MKIKIFILVLLANTFLFCQEKLSSKSDYYLKEASFYTLGAGDIINVTVFGEPELSGDYELNEKGEIKFPLLNEILLLGLTIQEASKKIEDLLKVSYFQNPQVSVTVKEYKSYWINVIGEVKSTGKKYLKQRSTVLDVISECGGMTQEAGDKITIQRNKNDKESSIIQLTLKDLTEPKSDYYNFKVESGDTIIVHQKPYFYIQGEVAKPGKYELVDNLTLLQAIALAGGVGKFANERNIEIYRTEGSETKIIKKNLKEIKKNEEEDIVILPMDTIIVNKRTF